MTKYSMISHHHRRTRWKMSPLGLIRLLWTAVVFGSLSLGRGLIWWGGLILLFLIVIALNQKNPRLWTAWYGSGGLFTLIAIHTRLLAMGPGLLIVTSFGIAFFGTMVRVAEPQDPLRVRTATRRGPVLSTPSRTSRDSRHFP